MMMKKKKRRREEEKKKKKRRRSHPKLPLWVDIHGIGDRAILQSTFRIHAPLFATTSRVAHLCEEKEKMACSPTLYFFFSNVRRGNK